MESLADILQLQVVTPCDLDLLAQHINHIARPCHIDDLRRIFVEQRFESRKVHHWSPEKSFRVGDDITVLMRSSDNEIIQRKGRVVAVHKGCNLYIDELRFRYDKIDVKCSDGIHHYPSNCPDLREHIEAHLSQESAIQSENLSVQFLTPTTLSRQLAEVVDPELQLALRSDPRFIAFRNYWFVRTLLDRVSLTHDQLVESYNYLIDQRRPVGIKELLKRAGGIEEDMSPTEFGLNKSLEETRIFCHFENAGEILWSVAAPPSRAENKLDHNSLKAGTIRATLGVRKLLANIGIKQEHVAVPIRIKGNYRIYGVYDGSETIQSGQIAEWMAESKLIPDDKIYLKIDEDGSSLRLYSQYEVQGREEREPHRPTGSEEQIKSDVPIRDKIYLVLQEACVFLHYRQIHERVSNRFSGNELLDSIAATLSLNKHLFQQAYKMLWGLVEWQVDKTEVDATAIIFAVRDKDLVYEILRTRGEPMEYNEICRNVADYFALRFEAIHSVDFLDNSDSRIVRLADGFFAIREWKALREQELKEQKQLLNKISQLIARNWELETLLLKASQKRDALRTLNEDLLSRGNRAIGELIEIDRQKTSVHKMAEEYRNYRQVMKKNGILFSIFSLSASILFFLLSVEIIPYLLLGVSFVSALLFASIGLWYKRKLVMVSKLFIDLTERSQHAKAGIDELKTEIQRNNEALLSLTEESNLLCGELDQNKTALMNVDAEKIKEQVEAIEILLQKFG